jgi:hypothetical protein
LFGQGPANRSHAAQFPAAALRLEDTSQAISNTTSFHSCCSNVSYHCVKDGFVGAFAAFCLRLVSLTQRMTVAIESGHKAAPFQCWHMGVHSTGTMKRFATSVNNEETIGREAGVALEVAAQLISSMGFLTRII